MKIAIVIEQPVENGGGFQQSLNAALEARADKNDELVIFVKDDKSEQALQKMSFNCKTIKFNRLERLILSARRNIFFMNFLKRFFLMNPFEKLLAKNSIDLVYFVSPCTLALDCENINFIFTVWDLCHLDYPEFPEVRHSREIEKREYLYQNVLKKAVAVICDSEIGKKNIARIYNINPDRVYVNYFQPSAFLATSISDLTILESQHIDPDYLFYPAQFWAHKNHIFILEALKINKDKGGAPIKVVFAGTDKGNAHYIKSVIHQYELIEDIYFVGFVPNEHLKTYYEYSKAVVMPSYFGPTNIPPLEAIFLNRPIIYSDFLVKELFKRTHNQELIYSIDLNNPESLLEALKKINSTPKQVSKINHLINFDSPLSSIFKRYQQMSRRFKK